VGLWAVQLGGRGLWALPLAFVGLMGIGATIGTNAVHVPFAEVGVAASVLTFGLLLAAAARLRLSAANAITGAFAVCQGFAHGAEMSGASAQTVYIAGLAISTLLLHGCGLAAGF